MGEDRLLKRLVEQQERILSRLDEQDAQQERILSRLDEQDARQERILSRLGSLERPSGGRGAAAGRAAGREPTSLPSLSPELRERLERCIETSRYIPKVDIARGLLRDLYELERSLSGEGDAQERAEAMRAHTGLLSMLASVGVDTADLPLDLGTQASVLARVDSDLDAYERQARSCRDASRAEGIVEDLRSIADTLNVNRRRFGATEEVDRRLGRVVGLISELSRRHRLRTVYTPPRARRADRAGRRRDGRYVEAPGAGAVAERLARLERDAERADPALKPSLLERLDGAERDLAALGPAERQGLAERARSLRERLELIEGEDPLRSLASSVGPLEGPARAGRARR